MNEIEVEMKVLTWLTLLPSPRLIIDRWVSWALALTGTVPSNTD